MAHPFNFKNTKQGSEQWGSGWAFALPESDLGQTMVPL